MSEKVYGIKDNKCLVDIIDVVYPVGSIYMTTSDRDPSEIFGGTWVAWGSGRVPVGVDTSQSEFNTIEKPGGEKHHLLTVDELANHAHNVIVFRGVGNVKGVSVSSPGSAGAWSMDTPVIEVDGAALHAGGDQPHNNLQPYITCYMWKRTA